MSKLIARARAILSPITSLGWTIVVIAVVSWWLGIQLGWEELLVLAGACIIALVIAAAMTVGRLAFDVDVEVIPTRVVVGGDAVGRVTATNNRGRLSIGTRIEVPVGRSVAGFEVGSLRSGQQFEESFVVPTNRRSIIPIGPARSVKGDPLGIARREISAGRTIELFVHPHTVMLPQLTAGWIRDLEGQTTNDLSTSDVAFHTLREYVPGDDRRHIHWRTTARLGTMMVRQFVDTRRSHLGLVLSTDASDWSDGDEFELGVSVMGSLGRTAFFGEQDLTAVSGTQPIAALTPTMFLDALSGVERDDNGPNLRDLVVRSLLFTRGASVVALVVGSGVDRNVIRAACEYYGQDVRVMAIRCVVGADARQTRIGNVSMVDVGDLDDLARVLTVVGASR